jgi:hypothetical protein
MSVLTIFMFIVCSYKSIVAKFSKHYRYYVILRFFPYPLTNIYIYKHTYTKMLKIKFMEINETYIMMDMTFQ